MSLVTLLLLWLAITALGVPAIVWIDVLRDRRRGVPPAAPCAAVIALRSPAPPPRDDARRAA